MKTKIGLLVGGLALVLGSTASAGTLCGSVGSAGNGNVAFTTQANGAAGTASASGGIGTITCNSFTVPPGETLSTIVIGITDDANQSVDTNSQITWVWTYSGIALNPSNPAGTFSETGNGVGAFGNCTGTGSLICDANATFSPVVGINGAPVTGTPTGTFTFTVTPCVSGPGDVQVCGGSDGLGPTGADSAQVLISFTYVPTSTVPEPATLFLIGSGLIGLGVIARRKHQKN